jgi:hypothetical protein
MSDATGTTDPSGSLSPLPNGQGGAPPRPRPSRRSVAVSSLTVLALLGLLVTGSWLGVTIARARSAADSLGRAGSAAGMAPGQRQPRGQADAIVFAARDQRPPVTPDLIPAGIPALFLFFDLPDGVPGARARARWWRNGRLLGAVARGDIVPENPRRASGRALLRAPGGSLVPGLYEAEVVAGTARAVATCMVTWGADQVLQQPAPAAAEMQVSGATLASRIRPDGSPGDRLVRVADGASRLYFVFRYRQAEVGTSVMVKWFLSGEALAGATRELGLNSDAGWAHSWVEVRPALPPGPCRAVAYLTGDDAPLAAAEALVAAARPAAAPAKSSR